MAPLTLDECLLLESASEDVCPLWEAAWMFATDKRERGERAIRTLVENGLVAFMRTKSWSEDVATPVTEAEQNEVLDKLATHEDWHPGGDVSKSFISFFITTKGSAFLKYDTNLEATLRAHGEVRAKRQGEDHYRLD
jgi:hypothetical protein